MVRYRLLYKLYESLYGLVILDKENRHRWIICEDEEEGAYTAELKGTQLFDLDTRLELHAKAYKELKEKYKEYKVGKNGRCLLF